MYNKIQYLVLLLAVLLFISLDAELLILKQGADKFMPLSQEDINKNGNAISQTILRYQWPMCIMSGLSKADIYELGSSEPCAEEIFIERKLREISDDYRVVFIPTTLYELFFILCSTENPEVIDSIKQTFLLAYAYFKFDKDRKLGDLINQFRSNDSTQHDLLEQISNINQIYKIFNNIFFDMNALNLALSAAGLDAMPEGSVASYLLLNQKIVDFLFSTDYAEALKKSSSSSDFSSIIEANAESVLKHIQSLFNIFIKASKSLTWSKFYYIGNVINLLKTFDLNGNGDNINFLNRMIVLEYEARNLNNGILIRGTLPLPVEIEEMQKIEDDDLMKFKMHKYKINSVASSVYPFRGGFGLYSISFGNSMFAGFLKDTSACTYYYLLCMHSASQFGYSLFLDKKDYLMHVHSMYKTFNLFYISPLASIAGIFGAGELFHSRTKVPLPIHSKPSHYFIHGLLENLNNVNGIILFNKNRFSFEIFFASYVAQNGRIIQNPFNTSSDAIKDISVLLPMKNSIEDQERDFRESQMKLAQHASYQEKAMNAVAKMKEFVAQKKINR